MKVLINRNATSTIKHYHDIKNPRCCDHMLDNSEMCAIVTIDEAKKLGYVECENCLPDSL